MENAKDMCISIMKDLDIYKPYINGFKNKDDVCFFEGFGGYWVYQEEEILAKMREIEKEYNIKVYAITHEFAEFGELWNFLYVENDEELPKCDYLLGCGNNTFYVRAYVWNKTNEWCSEFGTIGIKTAFGGIKRIS